MCTPVATVQLVSVLAGRGGRALVAKLHDRVLREVLVVVVLGEGRVA
jgi:hypothetical protein